MGVFTERYITVTVNGAIRRSYHVTVVKDAVASTTDNKEERHLGT